MTRALFLLFGVAAYLLFFATFLYLIAFVGDLAFVTRSVDRGPGGPARLAVVVDLALIALFGVQHSVMARPAFKRAWTRIVPEPVERSVYVVAASAALIVMFGCWRPIAGPVWTLTGPAAAMMWALFGLGWLIALFSTFMISHFELFGLTQVWRHASRTLAAPPAFRTPLFYRLVRHPLYSGFVLAFFATPRMTAGHLLLAGGMLGYILIAIRHEERDLVGLFGHEYEDYRGRVGTLVPGLGRRRAG